MVPEPLPRSARLATASSPSACSSGYAEHETGAARYFFSIRQNFARPAPPLKALTVKSPYRCGKSRKRILLSLPGADPINEAGMAALAIRQAKRKGAPVIVIDPRPVFLPFEFEHIPASPGDIELYMGKLVSKAVEKNAGEFAKDAESFYRAVVTELEKTVNFLPKLRSLCEQLSASRRPVIVCGTDVTRLRRPLLPPIAFGLLRLTGKQAGPFLSFARGRLFQFGSSFGAGWARPGIDCGASFCGPCRRYRNRPGTGARSCGKRSIPLLPGQAETRSSHVEARTSDCDRLFSDDDGQSGFRFLSSFNHL